NASFRTGVSGPRPVDTVAFACYRREIFDRVGLFDEELPRNQDDELNFRILRKGGRIFVVPEVQVEYRARGALSNLSKMYFQYGRFKPLVARKVGGIITLRQLVPSAFVTVLATLLGASPFSRYVLVAAAGLLGLYVLALGGAALTALLKGKPGALAL